MRSIFSPALVNDPFGDPGLYVDSRLDRRALLFDLGGLMALPPKKIRRISDVFVTHTLIPGDKICYVSDVVFNEGNARRTSRAFEETHRIPDHPSHVPEKLVGGRTFGATRQSE